MRAWIKAEFQMGHERKRAFFLQNPEIKIQEIKRSSARFRIATAKVIRHGKTRPRKSCPKPQSKLTIPVKTLRESQKRGKKAMNTKRYFFMGILWFGVLVYMKNAFEWGNGEKFLQFSPPFPNRQNPEKLDSRFHCIYPKNRI